jgi:ATP-binding cassette subfamily F protein 3
MIFLRNLKLQYAERYILRDASASIGPNDRIGLVGSNGAGKTTLLRILTAEEAPDDGSIDKANHATIGYLPQDGIVSSGKSLFDETENAFSDILDLRNRIDEATSELQSLHTDSDAYQKLLEEIGGWERTLENRGIEKLPSLIESVLQGLGFAAQDMNRPTETFSGGWQMRIALAKLLLAKPSLLLLDEPTNHLDITSQRWLEKYLKRYEGAILMVSHDRAFLDEICQRTFELSQGCLSVYQGNYSQYLAQSKARKEQMSRSFKNQQKEIERTERFIERFRFKASKASQVQSRIKALDKIERIEIESEEEAIAFSFPPSPRSGQTVIELENIEKSFGELNVFKKASIRIERGDRIAVVGVNGSGKSTLAKIIAGIEPFQSGERELGPNTLIAYFAQHQAEELDPELSVLETLENSESGQSTTQLRTALGAFLFHGDDVFKKTRILSGGERNRLALAKILTRKANFLVLDEPTNHLDMRSQAALQKALASYDGAFLIVSHNRAFVDSIVTKTLEIRKDGLSLYPGNVSDYLEHLEEQLDQISGESASETLRQQSTANTQLTPKQRRQARAALVAELSPIRKRHDAVEKRIADIEISQRELEAKMSDPDYFKLPEAKESMLRHDKDEKILESLYEDWNQLADQLQSKEEELEKI